MNVQLTAADRKQVYNVFQVIETMIADIGDRHMDGDYMGASLEAVMRVQMFLEQKRKELAMDEGI